MTEATKNKYSDHWFRKEANNLKLTPSKEVVERVFAERNLPQSKTVWTRRVWAFTAVGLLAVVTLSALMLNTQESISPMVIELSMTSQDSYFKSYSDFLMSDQYSQLEEAYIKMLD